MKITKRQRLFLFSTIAFMLYAIAFSSCTRIPNPKQQAITYLKATFPMKSVIKEEDLIFDNSEITEIESPNLNKYLQKYRFFRTTLMTGYYEYLHLEILVAVNVNKNDDVTIIKSPVFTATNPESLKIFYGVEVQGDSNKRLFCREVSQLFANITYEGKINKYSSPMPKSYSYELMHSHLSWRILTYTFDMNERLSNISIENPKR